MHIHPCILGDGGITVYGSEYGMAFMKSFIHRLFFSYRVLHLLLYFSPQSIHVSSLTTTELATFMTLVFWQLDGRRRRWSFIFHFFPLPPFIASLSVQGGISLLLGLVFFTFSLSFWLHSYCGVPQREYDTARTIKIRLIQELPPTRPGWVGLG